MEIQLILPSSATSSATTTPYVTAPSTPHRLPGFFYSAPTSPTHADEEDDFAFDFSGQLQPPSLSAADELFHGGKIKPLKPISDDPPKPPTTSSTQAFSKKNFDFSTQALNQTPYDHTQNPPKRGRETTTTTTTRATGRTRENVSRSASPFRISDILSDDEDNHDQKNSVTWYNKWNLKNLLLFRSASEGSDRRIGRKSKDTVNKYSRIRKGDDDAKNSSFRSTDSCSSVVGSSRRVMRKVSAHEIHYTANRAVAEEMRRKTYLPYKSGLLGCLGFHTNGVGCGGSVHEISRGITTVIKQRGV